MRRALVTATNPGFFPGAVALLESAQRHHPDIPRWCYVVEQDLAAATKALGHLAHVVPVPRRIEFVPESMQICVAKLFAATLDVDRVAYVDADAFFCRPAPELWVTEPGKWNVIRDGSRNVFGTVPEGMRDEFRAQFPDIVDAKPFNGGVWAFDPAEFRDLPERYEAAMEAGRYQTYKPVFDQPMLNALIQPNVNWLPFQFNVNNLFDHTIPPDTRIVHFTGGESKPWDARYPKHEPQYYWWLKHGLNERRPLKLAAAKARIWFITPKRIIGRKVRDLLGKS